MVVHVFRNLFWKICPLFGQILITCLKCSRLSFSPSSYSEKKRWSRGCELLLPCIFNNKDTNTISRTKQAIEKTIHSNDFLRGNNQCVRNYQRSSISLTIKTFGEYMKSTQSQQSLRIHGRCFNNFFSTFLWYLLVQSWQRRH